jgi:hypothetical protein
MSYVDPLFPLFLFTRLFFFIGHPLPLALRHHSPEVGDMSVLWVSLLVGAVEPYSGASKLYGEDGGGRVSDFGKSAAKVIPLKPSRAASAWERKWGAAVLKIGFCGVPSLLLRAQRRLKITPTQLALLMHLVDYWWDADRKPYPSKKTLGERLGLSARQVQRYAAELEEMGLLKRIERTAPQRGKQSNFYDLTGLVERLKELEPEFRRVEDDIRAARKAVARPGLRRGRKVTI